ncbi:hypothetical protein ACFLTE_10160 [Bacteroidota bacterium]
MKESSKYFIYKDKKLVVEILAGDTKSEIDEHINFKKTLAADPDFDPKFDSIIDMRKTHLKSMNEIEATIKYYFNNAKQVPNLLAKRKCALITSTPDQVAATYIYESFKELPIDYKIFSTVEASLIWLGINDFDTTIFDK